MGLINQECYCKGVIVSGGFGVTGSGLPQSIWMLKASEVYDPEGEEYLPADSEADEMTAYLCMFNHDGKENFNNPKINGEVLSVLVDPEGNPSLSMFLEQDLLVETITASDVQSYLTAWAPIDQYIEIQTVPR